MQTTNHRLMPNMLRALDGNVALADQVIAEVEDSIWIVEHDRRVIEKMRDLMPEALRSYIDTYLWLEYGQERESASRMSELGECSMTFLCPSTAGHLYGCPDGQAFHERDVADE